MGKDYTARFTDRADYYSKYRPGYPRGVLSLLEKEVGLSSGTVVADIGSGTGLFSRLFLGHGNKVFAVEPNDSMRSFAERDLSKYKRYVSISGTSENTTLPSSSVGLITVAQALHWFNKRRTLREFRRIAKPEASLCVVYNKRRGEDKVMEAYRMVGERNRRAGDKVPSADDPYIQSYFKEGKPSKFTLSNRQVLSYQGLLGRILSASYMPTKAEGRRYSRLEEEVKRLFAHHSKNGRVTLTYDTNVYLGNLG